MYDAIKQGNNALLLEDPQSTAFVINKALTRQQRNILTSVKVAGEQLSASYAERIIDLYIRVHEEQALSVRRGK